MKKIQRILTHIAPRIYRNHCTSSTFTTIPIPEYNERRTRLAQLIAQASEKNAGSSTNHVVIIPSAELQYMSLHVPYPFHQDSYFQYLTGFKEANSLYMMEVDSTKDGHFSEQLFVEDRTPHSLLWDGPTIGPVAAVEATGITNCHSYSSFIDILLPTMKKYKGRKICLWYSPLSQRAYDPDKRPVNLHVYRNILGINDDLKSLCTKIDDPERLIDQLRVTKSSNEQKIMKNAVDVMSTAMSKAMKVSHPNMNEAMLWNEIEYESRSMGARLSYPPVVAGGCRANTIHYLANCEEVKPDDLVLVDAGCRVEGYTSDLTRTWPISGKYSAAQKILYDIVYHVQRKCESAACPERSLSDLNELMLTEMHTLLMGEGIISNKCTVNAVRRICPHFIGHYLGLDVHDTPSISVSRPLQPGVAFPIEPGLYFRPELKDMGIPDEFFGIGMRLEDDFIMQQDGTVCRLSDQLPRSASEIEALLSHDDTEVLKNRQLTQNSSSSSYSATV